MYSEILVPTDGEETTERVLDHTIEIADERDVRIHRQVEADATGSFGNRRFP